MVRKPRIPHKCNTCLDRNYLLECDCHCGQIIFKRDKYGGLQHFVKGHVNKSIIHPPKIPYKCIRCLDRCVIIQCNCGLCNETLSLRDSNGMMRHVIVGHGSRKIKHNCLRCKDQSWIISCKCGCGGTLCRRDNSGILRKYIQGHTHNGRKGINAIGWKLGRYKDAKGYWRIHVGNYETVRKHKFDRVMEHVYFFEEKHQCCMLKWGHVHHIDFNKDNNMPWNLKGMPDWEHLRLHKTGNQYGKKDMSGRRCKICGSEKTRMQNGNARWYGNNEDGFMCNKCGASIRRYKENRKFYNPL